MVYCGVTFPCEGVSLAKCVRLIYICRLKTLCKFLLLVPPLWCEDEMLPHKSQWIERTSFETVADALWQPFKLAREQANSLQDEESQAAIKQIIGKYSVSLSLCDQYFVVDAGFFQSMFGEPGASMVSARVLALFPADGDQKGPRDFRTGLEAFMKTGLFKFAPEVAKAEVREVLKAVKAITEGDPPKLPQNSTEALNDF